MSIIDELGKKAGQAAQATAKRTRELAEITKLNFAISSEEEKIKKAHIELGKLYFRDFEAKVSPQYAEYLPWCEKIIEAKKAVEAYRKQIESLRTGEIASDQADSEGKIPDGLPIESLYIDEQEDE